MNNPPKVVLDACVLVPIQVCDTLLRLADCGLYEPRWSPTILEETARTLINKLNRSEDSTHRRIAAMEEAFPLASVYEFEDLIPELTNHWKDRHVLAAAIRGEATTIVTVDANGFAPDALRKWNIEAVTPDQFLTSLLDVDPSMVVSRLREQRQAYSKPSYSPTKFYDALGKSLPEFADMARSLDSEQRRETPPPFESVTDEDAFDAFFPDGVDPDSPLGAGFLWVSALSDPEKNRHHLEYLSEDPPVWGDYSETAEALDRYALVQNVRTVPDTDEIVYLLLIPDTGHSMRVFGETEFDDYWALTLRRCQDNEGVDRWVVWGVLQNQPPTATDIA